MPRWSRWSEDDGTATLEFITAGLILLLPLVYLVLSMAAIQGGALAVEGAARQAVRVFVQAPDLPEATAQAEQAVRFALADYGLDADDAVVSVTCSPRPGECLTRLGTVTFAVAMTIPLPVAPPLLTGGEPLGVPVHSSATERVSRFWSGG
jgi:hypothetical protein